jgi:hypothetical protein
MNDRAYAWPVCPRPESDESLPSWFERVSHEYTMTPIVVWNRLNQWGVAVRHPGGGRRPG